ncbi:MAG: DUF86 domain-containing protein [Bacteroidales bacterium]|nr:DUF86 domain-containing protein [Bacteroidales bacterium]
MREEIRDRDRLEHIIEAIDHITEFSDGKTKKEIEADYLRYYGIIKNIEIVGEAAYKLTHSYRQKHPDTPWEFIARMRHVLVHDYYQIDSREVWKVIQEDLRPLRDQVAHYLSETDWDEWENNTVVIKESTVQKFLTQTVQRMKNKGYDTKEICSITGLSKEDVEGL